MNRENSLFEIRAARVESPRPEDLIHRAQRTGLQTQCTVVILDADRIAGTKHVEAAIQHAIRAFREKSSIADSLEMEILLYAGGTRQTSIGRDFGIVAETRNLYLCFIPPSAEAVKEMGQWVRYVEDYPEEINEEKATRLALLFGITREERDAAGEDRIQDLVLERVALLDVYK